MIPWKMWFSGIRDYQPTVMDLSGQDKHVLITGPNGAGKSTITYCMGVVLYSSKVELEGLKSRNLLPQAAWKAHIRLLFKNEGRMRIDAPAYVEFAVHMLQEPGQPTKKEFVVSSGDDPDQWEEVTRYTSGDRQYNFTAYKKDLQYKYKLDPDLFYLIWYQQEVNQFAVMDPQERFRIFAEMHGIDQVQRNWEESMEQLKDVQESLRSAEANVVTKQQWLSIARTALERYEDNRRRLQEGGQLYISALLRLERSYRQEQKHYEAKVEQLLLEQDVAREWQEEVREQNIRIHESLEQIQAEIVVQDEKMAGLNDHLSALSQDIEDTKAAIVDLELQLKEIDQEKLRIARTEEEVHSELTSVNQQLHETDSHIEQALADIEQAEQLRTDIMASSAKLWAQMQQDQAQDQQHQERLRRYRASHEVQQMIERLGQALRQSKAEHDTQSRQLRDIQDEHSRLQHNRMWSARQQESLALFQSNGVRAYAFNELLELQEQARLSAEERFEAIKYAVFFDGMHVQAPNDLYHVPLRSIIPTSTMFAVPALGLRVKQDLKEDIFPHAVKALWWAAQFFTAADIRIEQGLLIDAKGIRGAQEKRSYILSQQAMRTRKEEVDKKLHELQASLARLTELIDRDTLSQQELHAIIQLVRESEAFLTKKHERAGRAAKYAEELRMLEELKEQIQQRKTEHTQMLGKRAELVYFQGILQHEAEFYVLLGQQKGQYELLQAKRLQLDGLTQQQSAMMYQLEQLSNQANLLDKDERKAQRELQSNQDELQQGERNEQQIERQIKAAAEGLDQAKLDMLGTMDEIEVFKLIAHAMYNEAADELEEGMAPAHQHASIPKLRSELESGRIKFDTARNEEGIDPAAPENYKVVEEEYHRLQDEYKRTNLLFEENQTRTEHLRDQLETTINMRVLEIQQRFRNYMSSFQFEGQIDWSQHEDRRGRTHFNLFIKARKEGHRGQLEDVSLKARGGRVGKGVSGGEESLSSLLFALALLQNLQSAPGFIVMDEFDSALDEQRKLKVFDLYASELERKLMILSPKSHESSYLNRFSKAYIVQHDPTLPRSKVTGLILKDSE